MKKYILLVVIIAFFILNLPFVRVLSLSNRKNFSEKIYSSSALDGFCVNYTHSVNKGRVHDFYAPTKDGKLELFKTEFVSYGAGIPEPSETEGAVFYSTENGYVIENLHRVVPKLLMAVGVVAEHSVTVGNSEFFLKDFFKPQTSLLFEVKKVSALSYLITKKMEDKNG